MNKIQKLIKLSLIAVIVVGIFSNVFMVKAANLKPFAVIRIYGYDDVLIADSNSYYFISYGYGCNSYDFPEGGVIYIDTYYTPGYFNDIYVSTSGSYETCSITSSKTINNPIPFYVDLVNDSDSQLIVTDKKLNHYLIEYGFGCLGIWRYDGKSIYIDVGGSYLDGIGDTIHLFGNDQSCKVWDSETIREPAFPKLPESTPVVPRPLSPLPKAEENSSSDLPEVTESNDALAVVKQSDQSANSDISVDENQNNDRAASEQKKGWFSRTFTSIKNWIVSLFT